MAPRDWLLRAVRSGPAIRPKDLTIQQQVLNDYAAQPASSKAALPLQLANPPKGSGQPSGTTALQKIVQPLHEQGVVSHM